MCRPPVNSSLVATLLPPVSKFAAASAPAEMADCAELRSLDALLASYKGGSDLSLPDPMTLALAPALASDSSSSVGSDASPMRSPSPSVASEQQLWLPFAPESLAAEVLQAEPEPDLFWSWIVGDNDSAAFPVDAGADLLLSLPSCGDASPLSDDPISTLDCGLLSSSDLGLTDEDYLASSPDSSTNGTRRRHRKLAADLSPEELQRMRLANRAAARRHRRAAKSKMSGMQQHYEELGERNSALRSEIAEMKHKVAVMKALVMQKSGLVSSASDK